MRDPQTYSSSHSSSALFFFFFWVRLFVILFLCWWWVTAGALSPQLLSVACTPPRNAINPSVTQGLRVATRQARVSPVFWGGFHLSASFYTCQGLFLNCCFFFFFFLFWWRYNQNLIQILAISDVKDLHSAKQKMLHSFLCLLFSCSGLWREEIQLYGPLICSLNTAKYLILHSFNQVLSAQFSANFRLRWMTWYLLESHRNILVAFI